MPGFLNRRSTFTLPDGNLTRRLSSPAAGIPVQTDSQTRQMLRTKAANVQKYRYAASVSAPANHSSNNNSYRWPKGCLAPAEFDWKQTLVGSSKYNLHSGWCRGLAFGKNSARTRERATRLPAQQHFCSKACKPTCAMHVFWADVPYITYVSTVFVY